MRFGILEFGISSLWFWVWDFGVYDFGFGVLCLGFALRRFGLKMLISGFRVWSFRFGV